jgi:hypothetical protein
VLGSCTSLKGNEKYFEELAVWVGRGLWEEDDVKHLSANLCGSACFVLVGVARGEESKSGLSALFFLENNAIASLTIISSESISYVNIKAKPFHSNFSSNNPECNKYAENQGVDYLGKSVGVIKG